MTIRDLKRYDPADDHYNLTIVACREVHPPANPIVREMWEKEQSDAQLLDQGVCQTCTAAVWIGAEQLAVLIGRGSREVVAVCFNCAAEIMVQNLATTDVTIDAAYLPDPT